MEPPCMALSCSSAGSEGECSVDQEAGMPLFKARGAAQGELGKAAEVLRLAQQTADQAIADAHREAGEILARAREEADRIIADARTHTEGF